MALRVLLADESSTIKKVFQLALQDFAVDVRPVNVGVDVVTVAMNFKPDIIFADVLLQKKNGYDVCAEIKQHPQLRGTPVVLMWSGFMEIDEDKLQACMANGQLEKPFDVSALRKLVNDLVPKTQTSRISQFLTFPPLPEIEEKAGAKVPEPGLDEEDFEQIPIPQIQTRTNIRPAGKAEPAKPTGTGREKFRLNLTAEELESNDVPVNYQVPTENVRPEEPEEEFSFRDSKTKTGTVATRATGLLNIPEDDLVADMEPQTLIRATEEGEPPRKQSAKPAAGALPAMNEAQLEKIIRAQSAEIIESVVWKILPEIATQIIERELNRLLKERDSHP